VSPHRCPSMHTQVRGSARGAKTSSELTSFAAELNPRPLHTTHAQPPEDGPSSKGEAPHTAEIALEEEESSSSLEFTPHPDKVTGLRRMAQRLRRRRLRDRANTDPYSALRGDYDLEKLRTFFKGRPAALSVRCTARFGTTSGTRVPAQ
jgi:hypothetical protein